MKVKLTLAELIDGYSTYSVHYVDNDEHTWTVPVLLTKERAAKFCDDLSIDKVRIVKDGVSLELELK